MLALILNAMLGVTPAATVPPMAVPPMKIVVRTPNGLVVESVCQGESTADGGWKWRGTTAPSLGARLEWEFAIPPMAANRNGTRRIDVAGSCTVRNQSAQQILFDATLEFPLPGAVAPGSAFDGRIQLVLDADDDGGMLGVEAGVKAVSLAADGVAFASALPGPADLRTVPRRAAELRAIIAVAELEPSSRRKQQEQAALPAFGESIAIRQRYLVGAHDAATLSASLTLSGIFAEGTIAGTIIGGHATSSQTVIGARDNQRVIIGGKRPIRRRR